jgi:hypothetical protein
VTNLVAVNEEMSLKAQNDRLRALLASNGQNVGGVIGS